MDQVTQQNAAMVEESTAASHSLQSEANDLARLLGRFQLSNTGGGFSQKRSAPQPSRSAAPAPAPRRGEQVLRTMGGGRGGGAATAALQQTLDNSWEEF